VGTPSWEVTQEISDTLARDVTWLLLDADADTLQSTHNAQVATFCLSLVVLDAARRAGVRPNIVGGHSLGEYTALVSAGALDLGSAARLVGARADAMQAAAEALPGTMAAVLGLDPDAVAALCAVACGAGPEAGVWVANDNAPGQVVISGTAAGVKAAGDSAIAAGAKRVLPLAVGGAFHSPLMEAAQARLDEALIEASSDSSFADATLDVYANIDASAHRSAADWPKLLSAQLCGRVRWHEELKNMAAAGASAHVELGPGTALTAMAKRAVPGLVRHSAQTPAEVDSLAESLA